MDWKYPEFIKEVDRIGNHHMGLYKCNCGKEYVVMISAVNRKHNTGCADCKNIRPKGPAKKHGMYKTKEFSIWQGIKARCLNPNDTCYSEYGAKGITICNRWADPENGFKNFYEDMGAMPTPKHTIERINSNKNYEPSNCKWATYSEQNRNLSTNRYYTVNGKTQLLIEWSEELGISTDVILGRINRYKWSVEKALTTPPLKKGFQPRN
jgi:hypothetical protein